MYTESPLTLTNLSEVPPRWANPLDVDDIQGDVLVGLQKNFEIFQFFTMFELRMKPRRISPRAVSLRSSPNRIRQSPRKASPLALRPVNHKHSSAS